MTKAKAFEFLEDALMDSSRLGAVRYNQIKLQPDDRRIIRLFADFDTDGDDMLTEADFLQFYTQKAIQTPDVVWQNLSAHNIGFDLQPEFKGEVTYSNDPHVKKDAS